MPRSPCRVADLLLGPRSLGAAWSLLGSHRAFATLPPHTVSEWGKAMMLQETIGLPPPPPLSATPDAATPSPVACRS